MNTVKCTRERCSHYCGRPDSLHKALGNPIDLSILGNPHWMASESERAEVCRLYRIDLWKWIQSNKTGVRDALRSLPDDATLGCFCAPRECHCDIIPAASAWVKSNHPR